jgi:protein translocase SecG subunit
MNAIAIIQIILAVAITTLILLQERSSGMSGLLGADTGGGYYQARRGMEKIIFYATIVLSVAFVALAVWQLYAQTH